MTTPAQSAPIKATPRSGATRTTVLRVASIASRWSEWLVLLFLLVLAVPPVLLHRNAITIIPAFNLVDGSWFLDTAYKASAGIWFGRDVAFTYGPIGQWLFSAPARWRGLSIGTTYPTWYTLPLLLIVIATFLTVRVLLPELAAWRRALLLLLAVVFWSPPDLRISLCLLAFAIFMRLTASAAVFGNSIAPLAAAAAAICITGFWLSADTGLYFTAALLLCIVATAIPRRRTARLARLALLATMLLGALVLLTNVAMASLVDFRFWRASLTIATGYRWFEAVAMDKADKRVLLETVALGIVVFGAAWWWRRPAGSWTRRPAFLISAFCLGLLITQTALVRSDYGHVRMGIYPLIFLCAVIAFDEFDSKFWSIALPSATVIATMVIASAYPAYRPAEVLRWLRHTAHPLRTCPAGMTELDRACLSASDAALITQISSYVDSHTPAGAPIAVFPYATAFGFTSRHQVAGGVLQSYLVNGPYLSELELAGLRRSQPPFALYLPDGVICFGLDSVPSFTRSPEVWFYLLEHYGAAPDAPPGTVGLLRDESRARLSFAEEKIVDRVGPVTLHRRSTPVELAPLHWTEDGADFIKFRLRANYPPWWRLRKPSRLTLRVSFADGTQKFVFFVMQPNRTNDIWIYPWDEKQMGNYFLPDESEWRPGNRPAITAMTLLITPFDWLSVVPRSVVIDSVSAVRLNSRKNISPIALESGGRENLFSPVYSLPSHFASRHVTNRISADVNHNTR